MATHGPFASKTNAKKYASRMRKKGLNCNLYKKKGKWWVSHTR